MTATTRTSTARVTNAHIAAQLEGLTNAVTQLLGVIAGNMSAGTHATSGAVVDITSAPSATKRPRKTAAKTAPAKASAGTAKTAKKPTDAQAAAKRAEQAQAWAQHKEIRSLVNKAYVAAGVKFTAGTLDRFADEAAVNAMLAKIDPARKADAMAFVAKMVAKHNAA